MKRHQMIGMAVLTLLLVAGCGQKAEPVPQPDAAQPAAAQEPSSNSNQPPVTAEQKQTTKTISVFYSDNNLMELQKEEQEISFADDIEKYKKTIDALGNPKKPDTHVALWAGFHYHSIRVDKGTLTIDADSKNQYNMGSSGEAMALDALKEALFQFPEVKSITILVDGKKAESLMGHVDISEPLTRK